MSLNFLLFSEYYVNNLFKSFYQVITDLVRLKKSGLIQRTKNCDHIDGLSHCAGMNRVLRNIRFS